MTESSTSLIVHGATGRMGSRILALAATDPAVRIEAALVRAGSPRTGDECAAPGVRLQTAQNPAGMGVSRGVVIDFSSDEGARAAMQIAVAQRAALLIGTTALSPQTLAEARAASASIPILIAPNTSLGVAVVAKIIQAAARALGPAFECSIIEAHHSRKKDAPSGTALRLAAAVRSAPHELRDDQIIAIRGGDVIGEHTVRFAGPGEYIEFTHRATTRDLFALGAITAAKWLAKQPPGLYSMEHMLGMPA